MAKTKEQLDAQGHTGPIYAVGEPVPASTRGGIRTKGLPYSRCKLLSMEPSNHTGEPGQIIVRHPRNGIKRLRATPELIRLFMPAAPEPFYAYMMGQQPQQKDRVMSTTE